MTAELIAILEGREMGRIARDKWARLTLTYNEEWRTIENAYPLSISMPLALVQHGVASRQPDGARSMGEEIPCLGAERFQPYQRRRGGLRGRGAVCRPERFEVISGAAPPPPEIEGLDEADIAKRLRALREDHSAWRIPRDTGQFSLAGAQPKTALLLENGRWGLPSGRVPTTHILKPPSGEFSGHAENEHFCLELARAVGLPVVDSRIMHFRNEVAIVVERYDRIRTAAGLRRVHQEDICQALSIQPTHKYQNEGGPGIRDIVELLRANSSNAAEDVLTFLDSVDFNWIIIGTDAPAKNYALLIGSGGRMRLAPLYDLASVFPYSPIDLQRVKLSMKLGGEYRFRNIQIRHWRRQAEALKVDGDELVERVDDMARQIGDAAPEVERRMSQEGLTHPLIHRLTTRLVTRAATCRKELHR